MATARTWLLDGRPVPSAPPPCLRSPVGERQLRKFDGWRDSAPPDRRRSRDIGMRGPWALWNENPHRSDNSSHRVSDVEAARVLAVLNIAAMDAVVALLRSEVSILDDQAFAGRHDARAG